MNICVIGHGMMGVWHTESLPSGSRYYLVGRRSEPTREFALQYGYAKWSVSIEEALSDPAVDAVIIANPSEMHAMTAMQTLKYNKPTLVEIPIAMSFAEAEAVVKEAEDRDLPLGVVHPMRFRRERLALRERVTAGKEHIRHIHGRFFIHRLKNIGATGYHRSWIDNLLWHHTTHLLDLGLWMLQIEAAPIKSVSSFMPAPDKTTGIPMEVVVMVETEADQSLVCLGSYYSKEFLYDTTIVSDLDSYRLQILANTLTTSKGEQLIDTEQENCSLCTKDFLDSLSQGRSPFVTGSSVLPTMKVLQDIQDEWDEKHGVTSLPGRPLEN